MHLGKKLPTDEGVDIWHMGLDRITSSANNKGCSWHCNIRLVPDRLAHQPALVAKGAVASHQHVACNGLPEHLYSKHVSDELLCLLRKPSVTQSSVSQSVGLVSQGNRVETNEEEEEKQEEECILTYVACSALDR